MVALVYLYLVAAVLVAFMAKVRDRRAWRWFLIALLITPLAAGILVVALPRPPPAPLLPSAQEIAVPPTESTLRIIRHSSVLDAIRPYVIYVNGNEVGSVAHDSVVDFHVPSGRLVIEARCDWAGGPPLMVEMAPHERIDIEVTNQWDPLRAAWAATFRSNRYLTLRHLPAGNASRAAA
jgi:hypothetical protein